MKLSEELKLRGAVVGDAYGYSMAKYGDTDTDTEVFISTYRVYSSEFLEDLLSGRYDEAISFLWLVDENGNKKERIIDAIEGDGMGCIIGVCNALAFTAVVVVVVFLLLGLLGN